MKEEKKVDFEFNLNRQLQEQIKNSKYLKFGTSALVIVSGILAIGYASKIINYALINMKVLGQTLKK